MHGTVVGVLRGGPSREHDVSLRTGHSVLRSLPEDRYRVRDIYIDREGVWHERGLATSPGRVLPSIDVAVIALHGEYGEDGEVQRLLERFGTPYTGSDSFASFTAMHKVIAKERAKEAGIKTPRYRFIEEGSDIDAVIHEVVRSFPQPVIIKPARWGSSVGMSLSAGYQPIHQAVTGLLADGAHGVLIEEFIRGTEATAGVVEGLRGEELYALPTVEIVPSEQHRFFTFDAKYSGDTIEHCPGRFSKPVADELSDAARRMHGALGLRHYSRSDFMISPRGIYYLETNTLPGLTETSLLPQSLRAVGVELGEFLTHLIDLALLKGRR